MTTPSAPNSDPSPYPESHYVGQKDPSSDQPPPYSAAGQPGMPQPTGMQWAPQTAGQPGMPQPMGTQWPPQTAGQPVMPQPTGAQWATTAVGSIARQEQQQHLYGGEGQNTGADDAESGQNWGSDLTGFSEKSIRLAFIKKVFGILAVMLVVTAAVMCIFMFVEDIRDYAIDHIWVYLTSIGVYLAAVLVLLCAGDMRRKVPHNLIFLGIITVAMGVMLGCIAATYEVKEVLMAVGITLIITIGMMGLGFQKKFDFTYLTGIMCVLTFCLLGFGLMCIIFRSEILYIFYACIGAALFSMWIVVDVQLMLGGKHKFSISPEEYVVAALNLYLDIINLLMYILMIIGLVKD